MGRLFFKLYSILVLAVALYFVGIVNLDSILKDTLERFFNNLSKGTFYLLENRFNNTPQEQWPALVDKVNQGDGFTMRLLALNSLTLSPSKITRINKGEMVITKVYGANYGYQRIQKSQWVLELPFEQSEYNLNQRLSNSTFNLIKMSLQEQPKNTWPSIVDGISRHFSFPVVLLRQEQIKLPAPSLKALHNGEIVWQEINKRTDFLYQRIDDSPYVVKIGPFDEPLTLNYLQTILMLALALLVALAVLLWTYPLWRDLKRLGVSAHAFGQGDFSVRTLLPPRSTLHRLAQSFNSMAERIQKLISSHKELTNAVSHELRTPIARLRFGMEMLQSATDETDKNRYITSMNTDINELDQLVAELLTYARFDRDKPTLEFQRQKIEPWLAEVIKQNQIGKHNLSIDYEIENLIYARFEPRLLARALGNLIQNAQRYAQTRTLVSFTHDHGYFQIIVEDDGPGIPEDEREHIFEAFKRLDLSRGRDTGGYGLGLAIAQRISQWHGGNVSVEDSLLGGARFIIRWPEEDDTKKPET